MSSVLLMREIKRVFYSGMVVWIKSYISTYFQKEPIKGRQRLADALGTGINTIHHKMKRYGLENELSELLERVEDTQVSGTGSIVIICSMLLTNSGARCLNVTVCSLADVFWIAFNIVLHSIFLSS